MSCLDERVNGASPPDWMSEFFGFFLDCQPLTKTHQHRAIEVNIGAALSTRGNLALTTAESEGKEIHLFDGKAVLRLWPL
jgi:hypothetical protein